MKRLAVTVEGGTEEEFVKRVLAAHLRTIGMEPTPILLGRARRRFGGGNVSVERLASEMVELSWSFDAVTSFVDFYGFRRKGRRTADDRNVSEPKNRALLALVRQAARRTPRSREHRSGGNPQGMSQIPRLAGPPGVDRKRISGRPWGDPMTGRDQTRP